MYNKDLPICPYCGEGNMVRVFTVSYCDADNKCEHIEREEATDGHQNPTD